VIAIAPKIAPSGISSTSPSSQAPAAKQSFSDVLEQSTPSAGKSLADRAVRSGETTSSVSGPSEREASSSDYQSSDSKSLDTKSSESESDDSKTSDSKTNVSKATNSKPDPHVSTQVATSSSEALDKTVPVVVVQPLPAPVSLPQGTINVNDFSPDTLFADAAAREMALTGQAPNNEGNSSSTLRTASSAPKDQSGLPVSASTPSKDAATETPGDAHDQDPATSAGENLGDTKAMASLIANLPGVAVSAPKSQPDNAPAQGRNISRGTSETSDGSKAQVAAQTEFDQALLLPTAFLPPSVSSTPNLETGFSSSSTTQSKLSLDRSQSAVNPTGAGTSQKNPGDSGTIKAETQKNDSQSSLSSDTTAQSTDIALAKAPDSSPIFSLDGIQSSLNANDGKSAPVSLPQESSGQQPGQLEQKSTGVSQTPLPGEPANSYLPSLVQSAKLVERIGEAELRLGIRAGEFGSVDIRTSMVRNQFTAEISVERGELGRVMAAELTGLQNRLTEQRVPVASITLQNHTGGQSTGSEQQKPRNSQPMYATSLGSGSGSGRDESSTNAMVAVEATAPASRLDIHM
jgi:hypothetical protein